MILVDSSVWIDHFKKVNQMLVEMLIDGEVMTHSMIVGELACGSFNPRQEVIKLLRLLPQAEEVRSNEALVFIETHKCYGRGVGWVDVNLLASCKLSRCRLWTLDKNLKKIAKELDIAGG